MGGFNFTNISQNNSYKNSCNNSDCDVITYNLVTTTLTCIIISIGLCLIPVAIYAVCSLVRKNHVAPIYVINLLISDLIQLCCLIIWVEEKEGSIIYEVGSFLYDVGLMASVGFMVCVALERYLVIAHPLWYSFRRTIKIPVVVCVVVWVFPIVFNSFRFRTYSGTYLTIYATYLLLPLPLFIFFLGGTIRALSASRVPSDEKRRIVGILVLVLLIYMLLFMPFVIYHLSERDDKMPFKRAYLFLQLSPLADIFLYVFMRKGTIDKLLASVCCCRMDSNDITSPTV